jgi:hypothetical protein
VTILPYRPPPLPEKGKIFASVCVLCSAIAVEVRMLQAAARILDDAKNQQEICEVLRRRIVKLRWMGLDKEADTLCRRLENVSPEVCMPTAAPETD